MLGLIRIVVSVFLGVMLGLAITIGSLDDTSRSDAVGPWHSPRRDVSGEVDPYALASNARSGRLPLGAAEGLTFVAAADSKGGTLSGRCDYAVTGPIPPARFWTLSLLSPDGFPIANPAAQYAYTSADALRFSDDPVTLIVSPEARAGNWLPTGHAARYVLMLRLYDTGLSTVGATLEPAAMPSIRRLACK